MKNLVMGFATNLGEASVRIFAQSLRQIYDPNECDIVVITNKFEPYFIELADIGVTFVSTTNNYAKNTGRIAKAINRAILSSLWRAQPTLRTFAPEIAEAHRVLIEHWHHPHFVRWFAYSRYLSLNRHYNQVFLADVKDVVFQAPFFPEHATSAVCLFDQGLKYGDTYWDTKWYRDAFGKAAAKSVEGQSPLCIGTMMGDHAHISELCQELCVEFSRRPFGRIEQAVFNFLILNKRIRTPYNILANIDGPVATLASEDAYQEVCIRDGAILRLSDEAIVPVVHMYDRFENMQREISKRFLESSRSSCAAN